MSEQAILSAYFVRLVVQDLRCFSVSQELTLSRNGRAARWTILLGDNGTGKTTLLQCLASMSPIRWTGVDFNFVAEEFAVDLPMAAPRATNATIKVSATIDFSPGVGQVSCKQVSASRELNVSGGATVDKYRFPKPELWKLYSQVPPAFIFEPERMVCVGYGAYRRLRTSQKNSGSISQQSLVTSLFDPEAPLVPAEEWFLQRDYAAAKLSPDTPEHRRAKRALDRVTQLLLSLLPEVDALEAVIPDPSSGGAQLMATTRYGRVRVSELGLGYQATLAWVTDLAARMSAAYPDSEDPLAEPAVVLVDEIDLHLHPRWQRALLEQLSAQFPNVQWVVTAHSPLIVQNAPPDSQIAVLRREGDHVVIDNDPAHVRDWRLDQILTSDLFGLPSARAKRLDALLEEHDALLGKATLTDAETRRLAELDAALDALPAGELPAEVEAMRVIREAARALRPGP